MISIRKIQQLVAKTFGLQLVMMTAKARPAHIAFPRQVAMYLSREISGETLQAIGEAFGGRDHGTVIHAHRLVTTQIKKDAKLNRQVLALRRELLKGLPKLKAQELLKRPAGRLRKQRMKQKRGIKKA